MDNKPTPKTIEICEGRFIVYLDENFGFGGQSVLYRGRDLWSERFQNVAVKYYFNSSQFKKMKDEYDKVSLFNHPHIVQYIGYQALENGQCYIVMEMMDSSLDVYMTSTKLTVKAITKIIYNVLDAIKYVHNKTLLHRDIKPSNILVKDGVVKLSDFGMCRDISSSSSKSNRGTWLYMSPGRHCNPPITSSFIDDIWSIGITILELIQGEPITMTHASSLHRYKNTKKDLELFGALHDQPKFKNLLLIANMCFELRFTASTIMLKMDSFGNDPEEELEEEVEKEESILNFKPSLTTFKLMSSSLVGDNLVMSPQEKMIMSPIPTTASSLVHPLVFSSSSIKPKYNSIQKVLDSRFSSD